MENDPIANVFAEAARPRLHFAGSTFAELFPVCRPWTPDDSKRTPKQRIDPEGRPVFLYMSTSGGRHVSWYVEPSPALAAFIAEAMLPGFGFHASAAIRDDGSALLLVKYDQIIGSRWLSVVPVAELPGYVVGGVQ